MLAIIIVSTNIERMYYFLQNFCILKVMGTHSPS